MLINYNVEKLKQILDQLCILTGINFEVLDTNFHLLYRCINETPFCSTIQKTATGMNKCFLSDQEILHKCTESCSFQSHTCHAGLKDAATPILKNNMIVGYIVMGQIRSDITLDDIYTRLNWMKDDVDKLADCYAKLPTYTDKQIDSLSTLLSHILFENAIEFDTSDLISAATDYIKNNLDQDLTISALCSALHTSKNVLYQNFHEKRGCTVNDYVISQRIKKACHLLLTTSEPVYEIAAQVGIYNYTYFCKLFRKRTGFSPQQYRIHFANNKRNS